MEEIQITMPIYWQRTKKKRELMSMNNYRNWHHTTHSKFKKETQEMASNALVEKLPLAGAYKCHIELYYERTNCDGSNIIPLIEKVVLDALTSLSLVDGDSVKHHKGTTWEVKDKDTKNPRCDIRIYKIEEE